MENNFVEIISKSNSLKNVRSQNSLNIKFFTNSIINPIDKILKYQLDKKNLNSYIDYYDFDNLNFKTKKKDDNQIAIVLWEVENIFPNKFLDFELKDEKYIEEKIKFEIDKLQIFFDQVKDFKMIIFKKFSNYNYLTDSIYEDKINKICVKINHLLDQLSKKYKNLTLFDDFDVFKNHGQNYYSRNLKSAKLPYYSTEVLIDISFKLSLIILNHFGYSKKVLVVDCDNTLWNGIIGEDDNNKIFSLSDEHLEKFQFVSKVLEHLNDKGIILAICSKNNYEDVKKFFRKKRKFLINFDKFSITKINWKSKSENILHIAKELNVGTSSFVFLDDSDFEISEVQNSIKDIDCIKVPNDLNNYKKVLLDLCKFFNKNTKSTKEDKLRSEFYYQENKRLEIKKINSYDKYLKSLNLELSFGQAKTFDLERLAQLTQKTNQFNLSLERQTLSEIEKKIKKRNCKIYAFSLKDRFGEYGTVGLIDISLCAEKKAIIKNFLMSCRVMGREVESTFLKEVIKNLGKMKFKFIEGIFIKGPKNNIVENFYSQNDFKIIKKEKDKKVFSVEVADYLKKNKNRSPIKIKYAK